MSCRKRFSTGARSRNSNRLIPTRCRASSIRPHIACEEAGVYIRKYFERFPGIRDYMEETKAFAKKYGYVRTLFGRKCHYPEIGASNPSIRAFNERAAVNATLQGSAADIIRRAMIRMDDALAERKLAA